MTVVVSVLKNSKEEIKMSIDLNKLSDKEYEARYRAVQRKWTGAR
jgi:hypothetical protein